MFATLGREISRTNSSALARRPWDRLAARSTSTHTTTRPTPERHAHGPAGREGQCGHERGVLCAHRRRSRRCTLRCPAGRCGRLPIDRRPGPSRSVAQSDQHPHQQQGSCDGSERLGQRADRQVRFVRARLDSQYLPDHHDEDEGQPRRYPTERIGAAMATRSRPVRIDRGEVHGEPAMVPATPQQDIDGDHEGQ